MGSSWLTMLLTGPLDMRGMWTLWLIFGLASDQVLSNKAGLEAQQPRANARLPIQDPSHPVALIYSVVVISIIIILYPFYIIAPILDKFFNPQKDTSRALLNSGVDGLGAILKSLGEKHENYD